MVYELCNLSLYIWELLFFRFRRPCAPQRSSAQTANSPAAPSPPTNPHRTSTGPNRLRSQPWHIKGMISHRDLASRHDVTTAITRAPRACQPSIIESLRQCPERITPQSRALSLSLSFHQSVTTCNSTRREKSTKRSGRAKSAL